MADDNKPMKYMRYAIGEILLVVIGILIALQINNWNEEKKQEVLEIQFLKRIKKDLISDTVYFNRRIELSNDLIKNHYLFIHNAYKEQKDMAEYKELIDLLHWDSENYVYQNSTYFELLNTGQINIFKNQELKESILTLYKNYDIASSHIKEFNEFSSEQMGKKSISFTKYWNNFSYIFDEPYMFDKKEWDYINNPNSQNFKILEYVASVYSFKHQYFLDYFEDFKIQADSLLTNIERELESRK